MSAPYEPDLSVRPVLRDRTATTFAAITAIGVTSVGA
jgi:hypothetical protein